MDRTDQACLVRMMADGHEIDIDLVGFEDHGRATDGKLADAAIPQSAADDDPLGVAPRLLAQEAPHHGGKLLRELLDRAVHQAGRLGFSADQDLVELLLADAVAGLVADRIVAVVAQALAPILQDGPEGAVAGAVAQEPFLVAELDIVAVDRDGRELQGCMPQSGGNRPGIRHAGS